MPHINVKYRNVSTVNSTGPEGPASRLNALRVKESRRHRGKPRSIFIVRHRDGQVSPFAFSLAFFHASPPLEASIGFPTVNRETSPVIYIMITFLVSLGPYPSALIFSADFARQVSTRLPSAVPLV